MNSHIPPPSTELKSNDWKYQRLVNFSNELKRLKDNKSELYKLYHEIKDFINNSDSTFDESLIGNINSRIENFQCSLKWPELLSNTAMFYGAAASLIKSITPVLIASGVLALSFTTLIGAVFFVPLLLVLPYFFYKAISDMSKDERILRIEELIFVAQEHILEAERNKQNYKLETESKGQNSIIRSFRPHNKIFNSTATNWAYLFSALSGLGIVILTFFSLSTPVGCGLVTISSLFISVMFACYHAHVKEQIYHKASEVEVIRTRIEPLKQGLFGKVAALRNENSELKRENGQLRNENGQLRNENEQLRKQLANFQSGSKTPGSQQETTQMKAA